MAVDDRPAVSTVVDVAADHPAFAGHFPGAPVLPGVVLLGWVLSAARAHGLAADDGRWQVEQVKFLGAVGPGSPVTIRLQPQGQGVQFDLMHGPRVVARGRMAPLPPAVAERDAAQGSAA